MLPRRSTFVLFTLLAAAAATKLHYARTPIQNFPGLLTERAVCNFGTQCGNGCAEGECCDKATGVSCEPGMKCTTINGAIGCCPDGQKCSWIQKCQDYNSAACNGAYGGVKGCCPSNAPFCDKTKGMCVVSLTTVEALSNPSVSSSTSCSSSTSLPTETALAYPNLRPSASPYPARNITQIPPAFGNSTYGGNITQISPMSYNDTSGGYGNITRFGGNGTYAGYGNMTQFEGAAVAAVKSPVVAGLLCLAIAFSLL
ncbi:hypothetical protein K440DRAFT_611202 [Wilcoxina mikolae CBS 423.85]|nr:hypothetical protein K440DRAFT_611202 [Wilcoxina mikolae CBS 423.85]